MTQPASERLFGLLPAFHRLRDAENGHPLRALLAVLESELVALEQATQAQYENWFIETCDDWVVPRIGELLGLPVPPAGTVPAALPRLLVADAIRHRRRKGVGTALEAVARDVSGWPTRVLEYFPLLSASQHIRYPRPGRGATVDLRDQAALAAHGGPFTALAARPDVRSITAGRGRYNIANIGVFVWRGVLLTTGPAPATPVPGRPGCYTLHPLGIDQQLAVRPRPVTTTSGPPGTTASPGPLDLPAPITRQALTGDPGALIGPDRSIDIVLDGRTLAPADVSCADLQDWTPPPAATAAMVALDPQLGRIQCTGPPPGTLDVSYAYRTPGRVGGGSYDRAAGLALPEAGGRGVTVRGAGQGPDNALTAALAGPHELGDVLTVLDDAIADGDTVITMPAGATLVVQAADGRRPAVRGALRIDAPHGAALVLDGLLIAGPITLTGAVTLTLRHCSVPGGLRSDDSGDHDVHADSCLLGAVDLGPRGSLTAADSVIDGSTAAAGLTGRTADLNRVTVVGPVTAERLTAADSILDGLVTVRRRQSGALRYCYTQPGSATPPRFRCQPDLAQDRGGDPQDVADRLRPRYRDRVFGSPGYADPAESCASELTAGAESGSEMGAYAARMRPQRDSALRAAIQEYLPAGLHAGVIDMP